MLRYIIVILNNLADSTSHDIADTCLARTFYWKIANRGDEHGYGNISIQSDCGIRRSMKTLAELAAIDIDVCTRSSQRALSAKSQD